MLPRIVNALAEVPDELVILLDDFHCLQDPACHDQVALLVDNLPERAHLVIVTRADPGLRLGRLRASGRLAEIRADQLGFRADEAAALLASGGVRLSSDGLGVLMERTEGWPAGLYLAALSLAGRDDPDALVHEFKGGNRFVGDYLTEEVLTRHSDDTREFITSMSILDRFTASLCDAVWGRTGSAAVLHDLERANMFLIPLDEGRRWYRFHHLFAAVARAELEVEHPRRVPVLHARAAQWFRQHDFVDEAVAHALAAGSVDDVAALVQANWLDYVDVGRADTVLAWIESLGEVPDDSGPAGKVIAAWMAALTGDAAALAGHLAALEEFRDVGPLPDGTTSVGSAIALIQGLFGYGGPEEMTAGAERAVELETDGRSPYHAIAHLGRGHAAYVAGELELAADHLARVRAERDSAGTRPGAEPLGPLAGRARAGQNGPEPGPRRARHGHREAPGHAAAAPGGVRVHRARPGAGGDRRPSPGARDAGRRPGRPASEPGRRPLGHHPPVAGHGPGVRRRGGAARGAGAAGRGRGADGSVRRGHGDDVGAVRRGGEAPRGPAC